MSKVIKILMVSFLIMHTTNAYATFDLPSAVSSTLEKVEDIKQDILGFYNQVMQAQQDITEGWKNVQSCIKADVKGCKNALGNMQNVEGQISVINVLPETGLDKVGDKDSREIIEGIKNAIYVAGEGNSIENAQKQLKANNAMLADDVATLFAKGTAYRQKILKDGVEESNYHDFKEDDTLEYILKEKARMRISSAERIARIIELRAYMIGIPATSELTKYQKEASESE